MTRSPRPPRLRRRTLAAIGLWTVTISLYAVFVPIHAALYGTPPALAFLLGAAVCGAVPLSIDHPRMAIVLFCAATFVVPLVTDGALAATAPWPWSVPSTIALVVVTGLVTGIHGARWGALPLGIGLAASLTAALLRPDIIETANVGATATADLIVTASVGVAALLLALLIASRLRIGAELTREREHSALEESRRALVEERTRIARELHDVIAHSMSVIQVQASTARYRLPTIDDTAAAEFDDIAATARTSLSEMRRMLGVLRTEDQTIELAPQSGIDDIPALVETIRRAGVDAGLSLVGMDAAASAPAAVQIAAYRIVQESLSNAVRHASGNAVTVQLQADAATLRIRVRNSAPAEARDRGTGHGLRGMRERTEVLGGSLTAGQTPDGAWLVEAALPLAGGNDGQPSPASATHKENP
ncbi:sensor histidine kinase [Microbacterium sp. NPDC008134]|uniref:sensor histidine kinase n=1 Tax=Microbacterium sp. NPDC008134 TaxID=3364183 RepID=UPI0036EA1863